MSLERLIHDVHSKCASLQAAAKLLSGSPAGQREELLLLMLDEARSLAECLARARSADASGA